MGRPKAKIDSELVEKLARLQCTHSEIAAVCGVNESTISRRFAGRIAVWREAGKTSLRRLQWKSAKGGNVRMQIHLGKFWLGQTDKQAAMSPLVRIDWEALPPSDGGLSEIEAAIAGINSNGKEVR